MLVCIKQLIQVTGEQPGRAGTFRTVVRLPFRRDTHAARLASS
jgi:hypothetical protein